MYKRILGIFMSLLMLVTCIGPTIFTEKESNVKATSTSGGTVGLDYDTIFEKLEYLSYIVLNPAFEDYGIRKGRDFGTEGEREAAEQITEWMEDFSDNLIGSDVQMEPIEYDHGGGDKWSPHKSDILGFQLQLKNGTHEAFTISTNESFPMVSYTPLHYLSPKNYSCSDFYKIILYTTTMDNTYPLDEYDYLLFNVTYTRINDINNFSQIGLHDGLISIDNYSNASAEDIEGRIHLINVSNNDLNETLNIIAEANATGYILIRNNVTDIQGWELPLPGVAVSEENGSLIKSYIQNESLINVSAILLNDPIAEQGNLSIYYFNNTGQNREKKIRLINAAETSTFKRLAMRSKISNVAGEVYFDSAIDDDKIHSECIPALLEPKWFFIKYPGFFKFGMKLQLDSYSLAPIPRIFINHTINADDGSHEIDQWVTDPENDIKGKFWITWKKNRAVESYNVYCTVPGKDQSKTVIISGGHFDSLWGQMATDDASGVAIMLGILKYMNDHHITPKYNLVFITFSGEEYGDKGSRGYVLRHWNEITLTKIKCILNADVIAHDQEPSTLYISSYDRGIIKLGNLTNKTMSKIVEPTNYNEIFDLLDRDYSLQTITAWNRTISGTPGKHDIPATDAFPFWLRGITAINFGKEPYDSIRHKTGANHTRGDTMTHIDPEDLNVSADLFWNVSKFFAIDPHCYFEDENTTYTYSDGNDVNPENDAVNVSFTIKTVLPQDKATVKLILIPTYLSNPLNPFFPILYRYSTEKEYIVTPDGINGYITLQLPKNAPKAKYRVNLILLNSTGDALIDAIDSTPEKTSDSLAFATDKLDMNCTERLIQCSAEISEDFLLDIERFLERYINKDELHDLIMDFLTIYVIKNDKDTDLAWLSPPNDPPQQPTKPSGPTEVYPHQIYTYNTSTTDPNQDQVEYKWRFHYGDIFRHIKWSIPCNSSAVHSQNTSWDDNEWKHQWVMVKARDTWYSPNVQSAYSEPLYVKILSGSSFDCSTYEQLVGESIQFNGSIYGVNPFQILWSMGVSGWGHYNESIVNQTYNNASTYTVIFKVIDDDQNEYLCSKNVEIKYLISNFSGESGNINETLWFNDTSRFCEGYEVVNWTWDFDDGTIVYGTQNVSHTFQSSGVYNVSLTVKNEEGDCIDGYSQIIYIENDPPVVLDVTSVPTNVPPNHPIMLFADIIDSSAGIKSVALNISLPDLSWQVVTMEPSESGTFDYDYIYEFSDTDQLGEYFYTITVEDNAGNIVCHGGFSFRVSILAFEQTTPYYGSQSSSTLPVDVFSTISTSQHYAFSSLDNDLVVWMPMDTTTGDNLSDVSGYDNNGVLQGNASQTEDGFFGKGVHCDGVNDYIEIASSSSLGFNASEKMTWSFWVKPEYTVANATMGLFSKSSTASNGSGFTFYLNTTSDNAALIIGVPDEGVMHYSNSVLLNISNSSWVLLTIVYNGSSGWDVYKNGSYIESVVLSVVSNNNASYLLGAGRNATGDAADLFFKGTIDDIVLIQRGLNADEIHSLFNASAYPYAHNFTGVPCGTHNFTGYAGYLGGFANKTETRSILIDTEEPIISNVSSYPDAVGFGGCVLINATVSENSSGLLLVALNISYPDNSWDNLSMSNIDGAVYQINFSDTWLTGQFNYSVWAVDNANNVGSYTGHHFNASADATISIATLQDSYTGNEYINITDPPNPPEDYTLVDRGLTWDAYYNADTGQNILEASTGPINFQEDNGMWTPINNTLCQLTNDHPAYTYGYRTGNDRGLYGVYFKPNAQSTWPVAFTYNRSDDPSLHVIRSKLVGVGYVDPANNWAYEYLQSVQSSQGQTTDNAITYEDVFTGTDVTWIYGNTGLKEEIILSNTTKTLLQNHPPSQYGLNNVSSYLVFITKLDYQNLTIHNSSGMLDGNITLSDSGVDFRDAFGQFKCALPLGEAYELSNECVRQKLTYRIIHLDGNTFLLSGLKINDILSMTFPVVIDPTLTVYSTSSDGYISNSGTTYSTVRTASSGTVSDTASFFTIGQNKASGFPGTYSIYRGCIFFNTSALPSNAYLDNATLSVCKKDDYSTTDFDITIQNGQPTYPHDPLQTSDYSYMNYAGNGGTLNTSGFTAGYNDITLTNLSWINTTGITKVCLRSSRDINGNTPTGNEYVNVYADEFLGTGYQPKLVIMYRNQSKIKNTGSTDMKGYLLIRIQFYNSTQGIWVVDTEKVNENSSRTINSTSQLALDTIFNGMIKASDLQHGTGTYRVYAAFRDPDGNILRTDDETELKAWWEFIKT